MWSSWQLSGPCVQAWHRVPLSGRSGFSRRCSALCWRMQISLTLTGLQEVEAVNPSPVPPAYHSVHAALSLSLPVSTLSLPLSSHFVADTSSTSNPNFLRHFSLVSPAATACTCLCCSSCSRPKQPPAGPGGGPPWPRWLQQLQRRPTQTLMLMLMLMRRRQSLWTCWEEGEAAAAGQARAGR